MHAFLFPSVNLALVAYPFQCFASMLHSFSQLILSLCRIFQSSHQHSIPRFIYQLRPACSVMHILSSIYMDATLSQPIDPLTLPCLPIIAPTLTSHLADPAACTHFSSRIDAPISQSVQLAVSSYHCTKPHFTPGTPCRSTITAR